MTFTPPHIIRPTRLWALIACAGTGSRAATSVPKQYAVLHGQPLVLHTLAAFAAVAQLAGTVAVVAPGDNFLMEASTAPDAPFMIAPCGGQTRAESVIHGLNWLLEHDAAADDWVLVHDAARCLIVPELIERLIQACLPDAVGGLLALPLPDTLKSAVGDRVRSSIARSDKWLAQTPQMFRIGRLRDALERAGTSVTDESSAMESTGAQPLLVRGSALNFKVTYAEDFALAQAILAARKRGAPG